MVKLLSAVCVVLFQLLFRVTHLTTYMPKSKKLFAFKLVQLFGCRPTKNFDLLIHY